MKLAIIILAGVLVSSAFADEPATKRSDAIVLSEFIFDQAPFPSCHASTIVETKHGLVAAWFGGTRERAPDVGIWVSRHDGKQWSPPVEVANGIQEKGERLPTWNPVLFQPREGPLMLFYKVGPSPSTWWGMAMSSSDDGATWSAPQKLPDGILGPIKDKPVQLADGTMVGKFASTGIRVAGMATSDTRPMPGSIRITAGSAGSMSAPITSHPAPFANSAYGDSPAPKSSARFPRSSAACSRLLARSLSLESGRKQG